jgi:hypothetical protein
MSKFDYDTAHDIAEKDPSFNALIMAAMRKADSDNLSYLMHDWPGVWQELQVRYNAPGGVLDTDRIEMDRRYIFEPTLNDPTQWGQTTADSHPACYCGEHLDCHVPGCPCYCHPRDAS